MFSHRLPQNDDLLLRVEISEYAERHFLRKFLKKYPRRVWEVTMDSICQDLARICVSTSDLQRSMQIDELRYDGDGRWIFKYDFRVAGTRVSTKASGCRAVGRIDLGRRLVEIFLIYQKDFLPKNRGETAYIEGVLGEVFGV